MRLVARALTSALSGLLLACVSARPAPLSPGPVFYLTVAPRTYERVDVSTIKVYDAIAEEYLPAPIARVGYTLVPTGRPDDGVLLLALRDSTAVRGANVIFRVPTEYGTEYRAFRFTEAGLRAAEGIAHMLAASGESSAGATQAGRVQVRGYCRRDGVCVQPHTRARPRSSGGGSRRRP